MAEIDSTNPPAEDVLRSLARSLSTAAQLLYNIREIQSQEPDAFALQGVFAMAKQAGYICDRAVKILDSTSGPILGSLEEWMGIEEIALTHNVPGVEA